MPTPKRGARLAGGPSQQKALLRNQATELFRHGRITTTHAKAKFLRPYAEKLITKAKRGDLHARRLAIAELKDRDIVAHLFEEIGPRFADRPGGYTRIIKLGPRKGDNAPMALIELVDRGSGSAEDEIQEHKETRSRGLFGRGRRKETKAQEATAEKDFRDEAVEAIDNVADAVAGAVGADDDDTSSVEDDSSEDDSSEDDSVEDDSSEE